MNNAMLLSYKKSQEFFEALEKNGVFTHNQKVRKALDKYKQGYFTLEEAVKEATQND